MSESEAARRELKSLEEEIGRVKAQLRELGPPTTTASSAAAAVTDTGAVSSAIPHPQEDRENDGNDKGGVTSPPGDAGEEPATLAASSSTTITTNSLAVTWISTSAPSIDSVTLELSSPVEQATLKELGDSHTFRGVETGQATLTIVATVASAAEDGDSAVTEPASDDAGLSPRTAVTRGTSLHDLAPLVKFDAMDFDQKAVESTVIAELLVEVNGVGKESANNAVEQGAQGDAEVEEVSLDDEPTASKAALAFSVFSQKKSLGTVTLRLTFCPSTQDRREELYEILNKATQRKAAAVEKLRSAAMAEQRRIYQEQQMQQSQSSSETRMTPHGAPTAPPGGGSSPAVRPGFLNKSHPADVGKKKPWNTLWTWYDQYFGPQSLVRQVFPIARNYVTFAVAVYLMHYKGQLLALPAPV